MNLPYTNPKPTLDNPERLFSRDLRYFTEDPPVSQTGGSYQSYGSLPESLEIISEDTYMIHDIYIYIII